MRAAQDRGASGGQSTTQGQGPGTGLDVVEPFFTTFIFNMKVNSSESV
jgi:hypothetical protein